MVFGVDAWVLWLASAIVLLLVESATISLIPIWFACGCILAVVLDWIGYELAVQAVAMSISSIFLLAVFMFIVRPRLYQGSERVICHSDFLGQEGTVIDRVDPSAGVGIVFVCGQNWSASSENGLAIEKNTLVRVVSIRGQKAIVCAAEEQRTRKLAPDGKPAAEQPDFPYRA